MPSLSIKTFSPPPPPLNVVEINKPNEGLNRGFAVVSSFVFPQINNFIICLALVATATTKRTSITKALNVRLTIRREVLERMYINAKRRNFHFLSELGRSPLEFAFRKDRPYLTP